jgi:small-conductance mechanosensitive channel
MIELLDTQLYGHPVREWLLAAICAVLVLAGLELVRRLLLVRLGRVAERTANRVDDVLVELVRRTHHLTLAVIALVIGARTLGLTPGVDAICRGALIVVLAVQAATWGRTVIAAVISTRIRNGATQGHRDEMTSGLIALAASGVLYLTLALLTLDNLGVNITTLIAGLGIGGIAIALAVQSILGDLFASLSIMLDRPFEVGDFIVVGDLMGSVEHVGLKTTRVRSLSGEELVFPNGDLLASRIRNFKRMSERRVLFTIGVSLDTPPDDLARIPGILAEIASAEEGVRLDRAHFKSCDETALTFEVVYYVTDPDYNRYMDIQQRINLALVRRFETDRIAFARPARAVLLRPVEEAEVATGGGLRA